MQKRILLVTDLWFSHPNGVATAVSHIQKELQKRGHTVDVLEPSGFVTIPFPLYPEMPLALFSWFAVRKKVLEGHYDHIHIETEAFLGLYVRWTCLGHKIPFTTSLHGQHHLYAKKWLGTFFEKLVIRIFVWFHGAALATVVTTEAMKKELLDFGLERVFVRPLGVDEMFFTRGTCSTNLEKPVFLYMGRISSEKSIDEFLAADLPGTKLVVGDGPDRKILETKFPAARFAGSQTGQDLIDWCSCADVFVMPSRTETFGLSMVECLALGMPVAAHNVTGPREIVKNGVNGYLDEDLARAAKQCLSLSREACRDSVKNYTWSASADAFFSILERVRPATSGTSG